MELNKGFEISLFGVGDSSVAFLFPFPNPCIKKSPLNEIDKMFPSSSASYYEFIQWSD